MSDLDANPPNSSSDPQGRAGSISREGDAGRLSEILAALNEMGPTTTDALLQRLRTPTAGGARLGAAAAERIRSEFVRIGWLESTGSEWALAASGVALAHQVNSISAVEFARRLCIADEQAYDHVITRILARMWELSPAHQGAVILPRPRLSAWSLEPNAVRDLLVEQWTLVVSRARRRMEGLGNVDEASEVAQRVLHTLLPKWNETLPSDLKKRVKERLRDEVDQMLFGTVIAPSDVELWQMRLDRAGLTLTARDLPFYARVWFPVGAFRASATPPFHPVDGLFHQGLQFYVHEPQGTEIEAHFAEILFRAYCEVQRRDETEYVSLPAVRDNVCFRLRISSPRFECLLQAVFPRILRGEMRFRISLEVDITPKTRSSLGNRLPIVIDQVPRYIIGMSERTQ